MPDDEYQNALREELGRRLTELDLQQSQGRGELTRWDWIIATVLFLALPLLLVLVVGRA
jgi:hypothetical protein